MSLTVVAAPLGGWVEADPQGAQWLRDDLSSMNRLLAKHGLPAHVEPEDVPCFDLDLGGSVTLQALRRCAAHLAASGRLPGPGGRDAAEDPVLQAYYARTAPAGAGLLGRLLGRKAAPLQGFDHLILHSDCEGWYLPVDFPQVLEADVDEVVGGDVGSVPRLVTELKLLAQALGLPDDLTPDAPLLLEAFEGRGGSAPWQRYGAEAFACCRLRHVAEHAQQTGTSLVLVS